MVTAQTRDLNSFSGSSHTEPVSSFQRRLQALAIDISFDYSLPDSRQQHETDLTQFGFLITRHEFLVLLRTYAGRRNYGQTKIILQNCSHLLCGLLVNPPQAHG